MTQQSIALPEDRQFMTQKCIVQLPKHGPWLTQQCVNLLPEDNQFMTQHCIELLLPEAIFFWVGRGCPGSQWGARG